MLCTRPGSGVVGELKRYLLMNLSSEKKNKETTKILLKSSLRVSEEFQGKETPEKLTVDTRQSHVHGFLWAGKKC